ncbi:nucleotide exchange factor GrpE [Acidicapsa dinghuensis]|uniref:Protein GrpE n=1 Tax=Acidicapsa dinghuensis TaxID=2218256 RepID=A0ABW1EIB7_9BACT|nr:nucleotide exchange factor GrpE [Acidicapsa dinghuensis]
MAKHKEESTIDQTAEPNELTVVDYPEEAKEAAEAQKAEAAQNGDAAATVSADEFAALKTERDNLLDRLARLQAEFDNARKRQEREKQEFRDYATGNVVEQFLPVLDNFSLALKAEGSAEQLRTGVELIVKQMDEVLRGLQVQAIPTVGQEFDPRVHEALGSVERNDLPDHSVAEEIRRGYKIRERLLRPAMVRVVSNPQQTEA